MQPFHDILAVDMISYIVVSWIKNHDGRHVVPELQFAHTWTTWTRHVHRQQVGTHMFQAVVFNKHVVATCAANGHCVKSLSGRRVDIKSVLFLFYACATWHPLVHLFTYGIKEFKFFVKFFDLCRKELSRMEV